METVKEEPKDDESAVQKEEPATEPPVSELMTEPESEDQEIKHPP